MKAKLAVLRWFLDCFLARVSVGQGGVLKSVFVGQRKSGDWGDPVIPRRDYSSERENHSNLDAMGSS